MANGDTKTNQYLDIAANGTRADLPTDSCCETRSQTLIREVAERIMDVEDEVERLENNPDVADIVATYADLQAYDTSQLTDKDVVRVLQDETRNNDSTYYRWSTQTQTWTYIGESKQYTNFVGTDGTTAGEAGLVPAPATTDAGKFLKADGTWDTAGGGGVIELSTADYNYPTSNPTSVALWLLEPGLYKIPRTGVSVYYASTSLWNVGYGEFVMIEKNHTGTTPITMYFFGSQDGMYYAITLSSGNLNRGLTYTLLSDRVTQSTGTSTNSVMSQNATTNALNAISISGSGAPTASTTGAVGQLYRDTTNGDLYICTAVSGSTYTWEEVGASGGGMVELTTADYNWNSTTGTTGTPNCVALWLLPGGLYKGPAGTSIDVRATATKSYSMGSGFSSYAVVKPYDSLNNRANVTFIDNSDGSITQYYSIAEDGGSFSARVIPKTVQTTGTSTTDVMSQNAVTSMVFADPSTKYQLRIATTGQSSTSGINLGYGNYLSGAGSIVIGERATAGTSSSTTNTIVIGSGNVSNAPQATASDSIALGRGSRTNEQGVFTIGGLSSFTGGYNNSNYRLLTGLYDGQSAHDAVTLGQLDSRVIGSLTSAPTTSTVGVVGSLLATVESGTGHLYICTDDTGGTYTWQTLV